MRAAASSSASGIPSSSRQISATNGAFLSVSSEDRSTARARARKTATESFCSSSSNRIPSSRNLERRYREDVLALKLERRPARHEDAEPGCAGKQLGNRRSGVLNVLEVVEHQKQVAAGETRRDRASHRVALVGDAQRRRKRRGDEGRVREAREIDERGTVGARLSELLSRGDSEPRLADAARAYEGHEPRARLEQRGDRSDLGPATHQRRGGPRHRRRLAARSLERERRVVAQDRPLELAQPWAGLDAELLAQLRVGPPVGIERVRLAAGSVEGEHQLAPGKLSVGMLGHERRKLRDELDVVTEGQPCLVAQLVGNQPKLAEPLPLDCDEPNERETRQGLSLPELECSVERAFRARRHRPQPAPPGLRRGAARRRARRSRPFPRAADTRCRGWRSGLDRGRGASCGCRPEVPPPRGSAGRRPRGSRSPPRARPPRWRSGARRASRRRCFGAPVSTVSPC